MGALTRQLVVAVLLGLGAATAAAQQPPPRPPADTTNRDLTPIDSAAMSHRLTDSIQTDTLISDSVRPLLPPLVPQGPMARGGRWVFGPDELRFLGALDLADLLAQVPGVFVVRGGWYGQTAFVAYAGQGAASVELFWDGYRLDPLGADSSAIDLSRVPIGLARRIEVEVLPTVLRVHVISDTQEFRRARTEASFATGDATTNSYLIRYLNRWRSGSGLGMGVNFFGTDGPGTTPGSVSDLAIWGKATWTPSPVVGVEVELLSYAAKRDSVRVPLGIRSADDHRRDAFVRGYVGARAGGMGPRLDVLLGSTNYSDSLGLERTLAQAAGVASFRTAAISGEVSLRIRDAVTPLELGARGAWTLGRLLTVSGYAASRQHEADRTSFEAGGTAQLGLAFLALHGSARYRDAVARPDLLADTAQQVNDWSAGASLSSRPLWLDVSLAQQGAFDAPTWDILRRNLPRETSPQATTLTTSLQFRPWNWLTLGGWYRHPLEGDASYEVPHHTRVSLTFRSRMLPRYRRGVFDLVLGTAVEGWSDGVAGRDLSGNPIKLRGGTHYDLLVEMRLVGAVLFWTMRNVNIERYQTIPEIPAGHALQRFGVRWEFTN